MSRIAIAVMLALLSMCTAAVAESIAAYREPTAEDLADLKQRMLLLRPSMDKTNAERVLDVYRFTTNRVTANCGIGKYSDNYFLAGGHHLSFWRQRPECRPDKPIELIGATLVEPGQPQYDVWVKRKYEFFAESQTHVFAELRRQALENKEPQVVAELLRVVSEDNSYGKQVQGTFLFESVETFRGKCAKDIINHLRQLTGVDFGASAKTWIEHYAR